MPYQFYETENCIVLPTETGSIAIPVKAANSDYQAVLDAIISEGADCFDGDIPADLQAAADSKQFNQQLAAYNTATARLAHYVVSVGRVELTEMQATGEQVFNEDTMEMDDVMASVITQSAIEAVEPTVEVTTYSDDIEAEPTVSTVTNPLIVTDVLEREAARNVIAITPQAVKDN